MCTQYAGETVWSRKSLLALAESADTERGAFSLFLDDVEGGSRAPTLSMLGRAFTFLLPILGARALTQILTPTCV